MKTPIAQLHFVRKVAIALEQLVPEVRGASLGVAVSGGPDSVALLAAISTLVAEMALSLRVLHVNHGLRQEAVDEQHLVEGLCARWRIPCDTTQLVPPVQVSGIEAWARAERYRFFRAIREQHQLAAVLLAHTLDDQAETVLFRLLRGSARRGLAGIPCVRDGWIVRPLLECTRQEVMNFLQAQRLPFATDKSNADVRYARNRIRHRLIPLLEQEFSPRIRSHLATLSQIFRAEEQWLDGMAAMARERVLDSSMVLALPRLLNEPEALQMRILRQWIELNAHVQEVTFAQVMRLHSLGTNARIHGSVDLPGEYRVRREGSSLVLQSKQHGRATPLIAPHYCYTIVPGQEICIPQGGWRVKVSLPLEWNGRPEDARLADPWCSLVDLTTGTRTLTLRNFQRGDRLRPLGLGGHKKVQDVFVDAKIPEPQRRFLPLLVVQGEIAWVPGCVRGEVAKIVKETHIVCRIEVIPLPEK